MGASLMALPRHLVRVFIAEFATGQILGLALHRPFSITTTFVDYMATLLLLRYRPKDLFLRQVSRVMAIDVSRVIINRLPTSIGALPTTPEFHTVSYAAHNTWGRMCVDFMHWAGVEGVEDNWLSAIMGGKIIVLVPW